MTPSHSGQGLGLLKAGNVLNLRNIMTPSHSGQGLGLLLALICSVKLLLAASIPLWCDEAYYSIWAENLQPGYHDHPPMIAWWIRLGQEITGYTNLGTRLLPVLSSILTSYGIYLLARQFNVSKIPARISAIWTQLLWITIAAGIIAIPDSPASLFWVFTCVCAARAAQQKSSLWWIAAGLVAGLACLSKYTAFFLFPGIALWLLSSASYRAQLATPGPWLAVLAAVAVFLPNLNWNFHHNLGALNTILAKYPELLNALSAFNTESGYNIENNLNDLQKRPHPFGLKRIFPFIFDQFLYLGPITFLLCARYLYSLAAKEKLQKNNADCMHFVLCTTMPIISFLLIHGLNNQILGYWLSPIYAPLALLAALTTQQLNHKLQQQIMFVIAVSALACLLAAGPLYALAVFSSALKPHILIVMLASVSILYIGGFTLSHQRRNIYSWIVSSLAVGGGAIATILFFVNIPQHKQGWPEIAAILSEQAKTYQAKWIGNSTFQDTALLYNAMPDKSKLPIATQINERYRYPDNHPSWHLEPETTGLLFRSNDARWSGWELPFNDLKKCFGKIKPLPPIYRHDFSGNTVKYDLYLVSNPLKNWVKEGC